MSDTKFLRTKKDRNYTVIDNTFIRDDSLSWRAKGVMTYLLSLPEDWEISMAEIQRHGTEGRDAFRKIIKELEEHGYLKRMKLKSGEGRFTGIKYHIIENPILENTADGFSGDGIPADGIPEDGKPADGKLGNIPSTKKPSTKKPSTNKSNTQSINQEIQTDGQIEWTKYPRDFFEKRFETAFKANDEFYLTLVELIGEVCNSNAESYTINKAQVPAEIVKSRLLKLNQFHLEYVIEEYSKLTAKVINVRAYLIAMLYNSLTTIDASYTNKVRVDNAEL